ncbi:hypothetical protein R1sor_002476 [Riccia sorocarpa]|uniref:Protein kinase domain-containing protein n=1 Tax=Riccia sorocarpa TaxID=122646 RepID=A0ABD3H502_9MARC
MADKKIQEALTRGLPASASSFKFTSKRRSLVGGLGPQSSNSMSNVRTLLSVFLVTVLFPLVQASSSQQPSGFISIDCGGSAGTDPVTGLEWVTDFGFLDSARRLTDEGFAVSAIVNVDETNATILSNAEQLKTAMVFLPVAMVFDPGASHGNRGRNFSRSKYCYVINVTYDDSKPDSTDYLIRAMFPTKNLTAASTGQELNKFGTRFYLTVDSTFVATIELDPLKPQTIELKVTPIDTSMYICLVPLEDRSSMPAISSLELRPLPGQLYNSTGGGDPNSGSDYIAQTTYFMTISRLSFGGNVSLPPLRYPLDKYDRLWYPARIPEDKLDDIILRQADSTAAPPFSNLQPPSEVLLTAWEGRNMTSEITFAFETGTARLYRRLRVFVSTLLFLDINPGGSGSSRQVIITNVETNFKTNKTVPGEVNVSTVISYDRVTELHKNKLTLANHLSTFSIKPFGNSTLPAMVNGVELYGTFTALTQRTENTNTATMKEFLKSLKHNLDTTGDACLPVPWRWLVCSIEVPPRITQINISGAGVIGNITANIGSLDRLTVLDLSNNNFRDGMPQSLVELVTLRTLRIESTNLTGSLPPFKEKSLVNLETLSLRSNAFTGSLDNLVKAMDSTVSSIDLSRNNFEGSIPAEVGRLTSLATLDVSFNNLSGPLPVELFELPQLTDLNLQKNGFTGVVAAEIWSSDSKLETVLLDYNNFTVLNLTTWSQSVLKTNKLDQDQPKVSLIGNNIRTVILPSQDALDGFVKPPLAGDLGEPARKGQAGGPVRVGHSTVVKDSTDQTSVSQSRSGFILLGENSPWCQSFPRNSQTLSQRYLCRSSEHSAFWESRNADSKSVTIRTVIIISTISGVLLLLMLCALGIALWRMWTRTRDLRQIQEALAKDDVRPPFFKYEELRTATKDFSSENELGKGAFGAVYKAVLADGTTVAVKRLFSTEQNIADFLKEVVLITGIKHRNLVQLKGCCVRDKIRLLVYEYAENKNLAEALWGKRKVVELTWPQRLKICVGIARGLCYLHEELQPKIIHRDIKPLNILLDKDWNAKIADFGLARPAKGDETQFATSVGGTLGYFSPEYATLGILSEKLDVYSYGVLVLEIVTGRRCIDLSSPEEEIYLKNWAYTLYKEDRIMDIPAKSLLETGPRDEILSVVKTALSCLQDNYEKRPSMSQVVNMLNGSFPDLATDIMTEIRDSERLYSGLIQKLSDASTMEGSSGSDGHEYLLSSSSGSTTKIYKRPSSFKLVNTLESR